MPEHAALARFADAWALLHEGGLLVETTLGTGPGSAIAMRTLLQLDGDRMTHVDAQLLATLPRWERLRVAARHNRDVQARSRVVLAGLSRLPAILRACLLAVFGAGEAETAIARIAATPASIDWHGLLRDQRIWLFPLLAHALLPYGIRLARAAARRGLEASRRAASREIHAKLVQGETGLP